jgi:thioredoxin-related protein
MLDRTLARFLAVATLSAAPALAAAGDDWQADFDAAAKLAAAEQKDLLVDFTGSDWCGWCIKLSNEVFQKPEFLEAAKRDYVLVALDYPRSEAAKRRVPNPARNQELAQKYGIDGFPTILLMTPEGDVFGRAQYQPGGAAAYVKYIGELREAGRPQLLEAVALAKAMDAAIEPAAREAAWLKAVEALERMDTESFGVDRLAPAVRAVLPLDPANEKGHQRRALAALFRVARFEEGDLAAAAKLDPKNELGLLELGVFGRFQRVRDEAAARAALGALDALEPLGGIRDREVAKRVYFSAALWQHENFGDLDKAKLYAAKARDAGVDAPRMVKKLEEILGS